MEINDFVKKYDPQKQYEVLINSYKQVEYSWNQKIDLSGIKPHEISSIIITGLGGSAISGELMANFLCSDLKVPFAVNRNYNLPSYTNEGTLVICSSYSGNTEETLSAAKDAAENKCKVICITTGGKLEDFALENNFPLFKLQTGYQPRFALWLNFFALIKCLHLLNLVQDDNEIAEKSINLLKRRGIEYTKKNSDAFKIAESFIGFIPVVYSVADITSAVGTRLKSQFNENSKLHSFCSLLPELNHNEIIGWETFNENQFKAKVLFIYDKVYHPQVMKRIEITKDLLEKSDAEFIQIESNEKEFKLRLLDLVYLGDWISYYLALLRGQDPSLIDNILYLKEKLVE
ncbi:bifunctional phosphoglucose/phosphomannose isomerase [Bacteroidota bacterium]